MGLLSDVYSYGDTLKRKISDLAKNPGAALEQFVGQLGDDTNTNISNMQTGYGFGGNQSVLTTPEQKAAAQRALADYGAQSGIAGMFVGKGSKTWDAISAKKAEELTAKGVDPRKVWSETGTWKGPDGHWRQEIPDNKSFYDPEALAELKSNDGFNYLKDTQPLDGVIGHGQLFKSYPELGGAQTHFMPVDRMRGSSGAWSGKHSRLTLADSTKDQKSSALHEMQHAIQQREGWELGSNPNAAYIDRKMSDLTPLVDPESIYKSGAKTSTTGPIMVVKDDGKWVITDGNHRYAEALKRGDSTIQTHLDPSFFDGYGGNMDQAVKDAASENYRRLAGEAEARATQARIPLDASQRRALFPEDSYDVPMDQLIIRGLLGK